MGQPPARRPGAGAGVHAGVGAGAGVHAGVGAGAWAANAQNPLEWALRPTSHVTRVVARPLEADWRVTREVARPLEV
ncbi:MAG TPA: hypothetical protein VFL38_09635, partial [Humibacillus xanthopallidus]|nr:hypothetical protein [Humibacillus xanthopallidus]